MYRPKLEAGRGVGGVTETFIERPVLVQGQAQAEQELRQIIANTNIPDPTNSTGVKGLSCPYTLHASAAQNAVRSSGDVSQERQRWLVTSSER